MTLGTFTLFTLSGSLVLLTVAVMTFAIVLLAKSLLPHRRPISVPITAHMPRLRGPWR